MCWFCLYFWVLALALTVNWCRVVPLPPLVLGKSRKISQQKHPNPVYISKVFFGNKILSSSCGQTNLKFDHECSASNEAQNPDFCKILMILASVELCIFGQAFKLKTFIVLQKNKCIYFFVLLKRFFMTLYSELIINTIRTIKSTL